MTHAAPPSPTRLLILAWSAFAYLAFAVVAGLALLFVGNLGGPVSVDGGRPAGVGQAVVVNLLLVGLFGLQHSVMARPGFKAWWTRVVPAAAERSTYVLASSAVLALLLWQWRALPGVVWDVHHPVGRALLWSVFWAGWGVMGLATFLVSHADLFGLRQAWLHFRDRPCPPLPFRQVLLYRLVRHPIMLGFLMAFWATPRMSAGHLLFAVANTVYILLALRLEEADLLRHLGPAYEDYRRRVPMLLPFGRRR